MNIPYPNKQIYSQVLNSGDDNLANGRYPASGSFIDTTDLGNGKLVFLIQTGNLADSVVVQLQQSQAATDVTAKNVTGVTATLLDDKLYTIDIDPLNDLDLDDATAPYKYVTLLISGVATTNPASIIVQKHYPSYMPITQHANTVVIH